jgi:putative DNA primase/helicase
MTEEIKDWHDVYRAGGSALCAGDNAEIYKPQNHVNGEQVKLTCLADVQSEPVNWVWQDYLARGKLTLLGGDPDLGKSQISIDVAARQSTGRNWPFGARSRVASTIFICSEDGIADTVKPRAEAAGADVSKLFVLSSTIIKDGKVRGFTLQNDLDLLGNAVTKVGDVGTVMLDAITSYMGKIENNSTTDVRAVLDPIAEWAEGLGVAVLGVTHPPKAAQKNAIRQFTGSFAYAAAPRLAFYVTKEPETDRTLLLAVKNNLGPKALGRAYRIATREVGPGIIAPYVQWDEGPVDYTADQAIAANNEALRDGGALQQAKDFLREQLTGPRDAAEIKEAAEAHGISERTLKRAKAALDVKASKDGFQGKWIWTL